MTTLEMVSEATFEVTGDGTAGIMEAALLFLGCPWRHFEPLAASTAAMVERMRASWKEACI
jgi:hypothetical protein